VPNCISKPSLVRPYGHAITPALLMSTWSFLPLAAYSAAAFFTEARSPRSTMSEETSAPGTAARTDSTAFFAFASLRLAMTTVPPTLASTLAVSRPRPTFPPVTRKVLPRAAPG
jgi:hypothetical protein